jgi:hypothetical protein
MTKLELLRTGLLGLVSYPAVIRITVIIIILSTFFVVVMSDSTFTNGNFWVPIKRTVLFKIVLL